MESFEPVTIHISQNQTEHLLVQSILEGQGIKFFTKNENVQNLFGVGQFGTGYNAITGPMEIQVQLQDADEAKTVINDFLGNDHPKRELSYSAGLEGNELKIIKEYTFCLNAAIVIGLVIPPLNLYHLLKALIIKNNSGLDLKGAFEILLASVLSLFGFFFWLNIIL
jgi:hypothetical protein